MFGKLRSSWNRPLALVINNVILDSHARMLCGGACNGPLPRVWTAQMASRAAITIGTLHVGNFILPAMRSV